MTCTLRTELLSFAELSDLEYRRVILHGTFDHANELYLQPRVLLSEGKSAGAKEPGAQVITPFYCSEVGENILVNRGWVPKSKLNSSSRQRGQVNGECLAGFCPFVIVGVGRP
eukprot:m.43408 g.43408  ORF g.43408 m.43408 type:complete len:113 (+) comp33431_c0_seq4:329-667(+)